MPTKPPPGVMDDPSHQLSQGCTGHWLFNEGAGNLTYDVSGHGNHGLLKDMSQNAQDSGWGGNKFGGGISFDNTNDHIDCGADASLKITKSITLESRVKLTGNNKTIICKFQGNNPWYGYGLAIHSDGKLRFLGDGSWSISTGKVINDGIWHHVAVTLDSGGVLTFYRDGVVDDTDTGVTLTHGVISVYYIGCGRDSSNNPSGFFDGEIDGSRAYNRTLSAKEIKQLYHNPFCNLMQIPVWRHYVSAIGLSIPVAMHHYEMLRA